MYIDSAFHGGYKGRNLGKTKKNGVFWGGFLNFNKVPNFVKVRKAFRKLAKPNNFLKKLQTILSIGKKQKLKIKPRIACQMEAIPIADE